MGHEGIVIDLAKAASGIIGLGGGFKNTVCLMHGDKAYISSPVGDLDNAENCLALERAVDGLCRSFDVMPNLVAHDLHPDFFSTRLAYEIAERHGADLIGVQHHHAHIASICAEHGFIEPVIGLALDGTGLGTDGHSWGGELLKVGGACFERLDHLYPLKLPGGDRAAREPWRMAAAALHALGRTNEITVRFADQPAAATVATMLQRDLNCPLTTSMGRLFDAAAGLLGICPIQRFEGEAANLLQALAERHGMVAPLTDGYRLDRILDFLPLLDTLTDDCDVGYGAAVFHATVAAGLAEWADRAAAQYGITTVACGGGCFFNGLLLHQLSQLLSAQGITVLTAQRLSAGDSG
ncbi:MAG: carbamoyltransferase HypF, partial [Betaproteobacteria bacterium HGW-Betaproteobacteria-21]